MVIRNRLSSLRLRKSWKCDAKAKVCSFIVICVITFDTYTSSFLDEQQSTSVINDLTSERSLELANSEVKASSLFGSFNQNVPSSRTSKVLDEFDLYICEPLSPMYEKADRADPKSIFVRVRALQYWKTNAFRFPVLAGMAKDIFSVPASSGSIERVFSTATDIMQAKRSRMKLDLLEMRVFIKKNAHL